MIVAVVAAATATQGLLFFERVADEIKDIPGIAPEDVPEPEPGEPYTLLLLGSDRRPTLPDERSDTAILLRLDPERDVISLLSLPRDLLVPIPGVGFDKLNAAYAAGGADLTRETIAELTGLEINGVVDVDFQGFADAVDAVGCVYVDVDRRYLVPPNSGYAEIDVKAGYQRLCSLKALQYVRYRHGDNDIVRGARQQDFLREARQRLGLGEIVFGGQGRKLLDAFTENTSSTLDGHDLREIARSLFDLRGASVDEIRVVGDLGPEDITASSREIDRAVARFLGAGSTDLVGADADGGGGGGTASGGGGAGGSGSASGSGKGLVAADPQFGRYARTAKRRLGIPTFYPTLLPPGSSFLSDSRAYSYDDEEGRRQVAYKLVISRPHPQVVTEYFGLAGTSWDDPPILRKPSETREVDGREYLLFYAGDELVRVGWHEDGNSYWLSNSLLGSLGEGRMLAIAEAVAAA